MEIISFLARRGGTVIWFGGIINPNFILYYTVDRLNIPYEDQIMTYNNMFEVSQPIRWQVIYKN